MGYFALVSSLMILVLLVLLVLSWKMHQQQMEAQRKDHTARENSWTLERERLLNRVQSADWQTYTQLQAGLQVSDPSGPPPEGPVGLGTDDTELERSGHYAPDVFDLDLSSFTGGGDGSAHEPTIGADG